MPTALMVGAHNEECEYNCGGLACKLARKGWRVVFLNLIGDYSNWPMWPIGMEDGQERINREAMEAARRLGAEKILVDIKGHQFSACDPSSMVRIAEVINDLKPEIMATHWPSDTNHDHREVARASFSAAQTTALLPGRTGFVVPEIIAHESYLYQSHHFTPDFYVRIDDCMDALSDSFQAFGTYPAIVEEFERIKPIQTSARSAHIWPGGHAEAYSFLKFGPRLSVLPEVLGEDFRASGFSRGAGLFGDSD